MMISDNILGENRFGTSPVREAFWAMMSTSVLDDLENVNGFISQAQYPKICGVVKSSLIDLEAYELAA